MEDKKKIVWIDWTKALCMIFVYYHHVGLLGANKADIVIPYGYFFVNTFFFISGYLFFKKHLFGDIAYQDRKSFFFSQFKEKGILSNVFYKIALPSILFSIIDFVPKQIIRGESLSIDALLFDSLLRGTFWFTCALCVTELIIFVMLFALRKKSIWLYFILSLPLFFVGKYLTDSGFALYKDVYCPWFYKSGFMACFFLVGGGIFCQYEKKLSWLTSIGGKCLLIILALAYCITVIKEPWGFIRGSILTGIDYAGVIISLMGIVSIIFVSSFLPSVKAIEFFSRHTIGFYFFSASIPFVWCKIIERFLPLSTFAFVLGVICSFITAWLVVYLLDKYIPFVFDFNKIKVKICQYLKTKCS